MNNIQKYEHVKKFTFEPNLMFFVSNIRIFRLRKQGGNIIKEYKRTDLNGFHLHHKITNNAGTVGTTPDRFGFRPSKIVFNDNYILQAFNKVRHKLNKEVVKEFNSRLFIPREIWQGSVDTNSEHLSQFFVEEKFEVNLGVEEILEICNIDNPWFKVPKVDFSDPEEMFFASNYNPLSNPGHYTSIINHNSKTKKTTVKNAYLLALQTYETCRKKPFKNYSLWDLLAREKDNKIISDKIPSCRAVMNPEHHVTMLLGWIYQKFMNLANTQGNIGSCRYMINKEMNSFKAKRIIDDFIFKYDYIVDADWTYFDATITKNYLIAATSIMFSNSIKDKRDVRLVHYIIESLVTKYLALPPGIVVKLNKGMPSGHPGVTAVNCIVNLIRWSILGFNIYGPKYWEHMDVIVYGDDAFVGFKRHKNLFKIDTYCKKYGFKGDSISEKLFPTKLYFSQKHDTPDFLKRRVNMEGIYWNRSKIFDRMIYQTRKRNVTDQIKLILGYIETAPFDVELITSLNVIINQMVLDHSSKVDDNLKKYLLNRSIDYNRFSYINYETVLSGLNYEKQKGYSIPFIYQRETIQLNDRDILSSLNIRSSKLTYLFTEHHQFLRDNIFNEGEPLFNKVLKKYFIKKDNSYIAKFSIKREKFSLNSS